MWLCAQDCLTRRSLLDMTTKKFNGEMFCPQCGFSFTGEPLWKQQLRNHPGLDSEEFCLSFGDCDVIMYRYGRRYSPERGRNPINGQLLDRSVRWHMIVEVKCHDAEPGQGQDERHWVTTELLTTHRWSNERDPQTGQFLDGHDQNVRRVFLDMPPQFGGEKKVMILSYGVHLLQMSGHDFKSSSTVRWDGKVISKEELVEVLRFDRHPVTLKPVLTDRMHKKENTTPTLYDALVVPLDDD